MVLSFEDLLSQAVWEPIAAAPDVTDPEEECVTHQAVLKVEDFELYCYRRSDGKLAFDIEDLERFMRGCPLCDHPSQCPDCNPTPADRDRSRTGLIVDAAEASSWASTDQPDEI